MRFRKGLSAGLAGTLAVATVVLPAGISLATSWRPPIRPLSKEERFEMAASGSDGVALGTCAGYRDSIAADGVQWAWMDFRPASWLKGNAGLGQFRVYFPQISDFSRSKASGRLDHSGSQCLLFLRHVAGSGPDYWVVSEHPEFPGAGLLLGSEVDTAASSAAARAVAATTPESLARRSEHVVLGELRATSSRIPYDGHPIRCSEILIQSDLSDPSPPRSMLVYTLFGAPAAGGRAIVMLKQGQGGAFEIIGFSAGLIPVDGQNVPRYTTQLSPFLDRLRAARPTVATSPETK